MNTADCFATIEARFTDWNYGHPKILYGLIRALKPKVVVEVGTYRGYGVCYMARAIQENNFGHLFCIDDFSEGMQKKYDKEHWHENLVACGVRDLATLLVGRSDQVQWPDTVDFAYIDGGHGYKQVVHDFGCAEERGAECICLDDSELTVGPRLFVQRLRQRVDWDVLEVFRDCGLAICMRRKERRPVEFSQELPDHPGTILTGWTSEQKRQHLIEAAKVTGVDYGDFQV